MNTPGRDPTGAEPFRCQEHPSLVPSFQEEDFPGIFSTATFGDQHPANIVTLQGSSRPHSAGIPASSALLLAHCGGTLPWAALPELSSSFQCLPGPKSLSAPHHSRRANLQQNNNNNNKRQKKEALRVGEEAKMVSKPGHIKRLFPWQPLVPTALKPVLISGSICQ